MKGWLIYDEVGMGRNKWFAEQMVNTGRELGLELTCKILPTEGKEYRELDSSLKQEILDKSLQEICEEKPGFVIMRAIVPALTAVMEEQGIPVFNNAATAEIANDKWLTYCKALEWQIPVMETVPGDGEMALPMVIKVVSGHGGSQVYMASDEAQKAGILDMLKARGLGPEDIILQKVCSHPGRDRRVYMMGDRVYEVVERSSEQDFRSNFLLGGNIALAEASKEQQEVIACLYEKLHFDLVGVDFIVHDGKWILNEIEDVVGTRMIYQLTDRDVVRDYLVYIRERLRAV